MKFYGSKSLIGASWKPYGIQNSLRFNASQSSYLSWTPASAGNLNTWTWSGWIKLATLGTLRLLFDASASVNSQCRFGFNTNDTFTFYDYDGSTNINLASTAVYRDVSAWYHLIVSVDTTQATSSDRIKVYINGEQITSFTTATYPSLNHNTNINNNEAHSISKRTYDANYYFDGYLTEVNFIDGQALDPSSFGENDVITGVWKPKKYVGTYGTNGFYLPMNLDNTTEGFNTVTAIGNVNTQKITGVGFSPDLVWLKVTSSAVNHILYDSVRGVDKYLVPNLTNAEASGGGQGLTSFDTDGFTLGNINPNSSTSYNFVGWCWDAGNVPATGNSDGDIASLVKVNNDYGFSIVTYTGNGTTNQGIGHGLNNTPGFYITKSLDTESTGTNSWVVYHSSFAVNEYMFLDANTVKNTATNYLPQLPDSSQFYVGGSSGTTAYVHNESGQRYVAYCWSEVAGFSKFGTYTGNGSSSFEVTGVGFRPAFLMIRRVTDAIGNWLIYDNTRSAYNPVDDPLFSNLNNQQSNNSAGNAINFNADGFTIDVNDSGTGGSINQASDYIYIAFADTKEYAYWLDDSGNNNDWQPNGGITTQSSVTDVPTLTSETQGNYCTFNAAAKASSQPTFSNANLSLSASAAWNGAVGTIGVTSGKWYWEVVCGNADSFVGICGDNLVLTDANPQLLTGNIVYYGGNGNKRIDGTLTSYGATYSTETIGVALDVDGGTVTFYKNNVSQGAISLSSSTLNGKTIFPFFVKYASTITVNFGQLPFAYTPPTGFKALNTYNLPDSTVKDGSDYFNTVLYTGTGGSQSVTGVGFQPDWVWLKTRNIAGEHYVYDAVRGAPKELYLNRTLEEDYYDYGEVTSFNSDGFTVYQSGTGNEINYLGNTYVAWNWKANGTGVTNNDGSITSTVSANPTAGFSIVSYTGTGSAATIGHGLGVAPAVMMVKSRSNDTGDGFAVYHKSLPSADYWLELSTTGGQQGPNSVVWNGTAPTSTVFSVGTASGTNTNTYTYIAYCFAEVEGFSKIGKYIGNGSADGPFVYTGFRPAFVLLKRTNSTGSWQIKDTERNTYNLADLTLFPNLTNAEYSTFYFYDLLSNGFKVRGTDAELNGSGSTYIYLAFAENPFKNSLAR